METNGMIGTIYNFSEWGLRLVYINILWLIFTLLGGVAFGFFPSTSAIFVVTRKWMNGQPDINITSTFWINYKKEFINSNILGFILIILGIILWIDYRFLQVQDGFFFTILKYIILSMMVMYVIMILYIFPVFAHYQLKISQSIKNALFIGILHPFLTLTMTVGFIVISFVFYLIPGILPFFSTSLYAITLMYLGNRAFIKIRRKII